MSERQPKSNLPKSLIEGVSVISQVFNGKTEKTVSPVDHSIKISPMKPSEYLYTGKGYFAGDDYTYTASYHGEEVHGYTSFGVVMAKIPESMKSDHNYNGDYFVMEQSLMTACQFSHKDKKYLLRVEYLFDNGKEKYKCHLWKDVGDDGLELFRSDETAFYKKFPKTKFEGMVDPLSFPEEILSQVQSIEKSFATDPGLNGIVLIKNQK